MDSQKIAAFFESVDSLFIDGDDDAFDDSDAFFLDTPMKNPENLDLLLAVAYAKGGDYSKSREMIKGCIKMKPGWKQALVLKAIIDGKMTSSDDSEDDDDDDYSYEDNEEDKIEDDEDEDEDEKQEIEKDLLMAHLLRIACSYKEVLRDKLVGINTELLRLHSFKTATKKHILESVFFEFWEPMKTNYLMDFTEIRPLGVGGFGWVMLCVNKLDKRNYAVKIIPLEKREEMALKKENIVTDEVCREARTLAKLHHQHVVRYHHAWVEGAVPYQGQGSSSGSEIASSSTGSANAPTGTLFSGNSLPEILNDKNNIHCLYIQMEYCAMTLSSHLEKCCFDEEFSLRVSRQIAKGLNHIHENGIVHRDLSPMNIFLDSKEDIKIGDFGLAKFLELDGYGKERWTRNSGAYGIPTYKAPELRENAKITQKVDMYSFGIILFELWNKFDSGNERAVVIMALKERNTMPPEWERKYPDLASLVRQLLSRNPAKRPSISEVLEGDLFRG